MQHQDSDNIHKHDHSSRGHGHAPKTFGAAFAIGTALNLALVLAEVAFGFLSRSLALISDGVHNFSDVLGLLLAWGGSWLATRQPRGPYTYGYRRASILVALGTRPSCSLLQGRLSSRLCGGLRKRRRWQAVLCFGSRGLRF
jgi:cobalt-zinc-cadmium efflux system protein